MRGNLDGAASKVEPGPANGYGIAEGSDVDFLGSSREMRNLRNLLLNSKL